MIPADWHTRTIQEISDCPVSYGVVQTGEAVTGGVPCVRVVDIASGALNREQMITTSEVINQAYSRTILSEGDVIIALRGIIGRAALVKASLAGCNLTRGVARIAPKPKECISEYLLQTLNSPIFQAHINRQANGSALQEISIATLRAQEIMMPPLAEQRGIAEILSAWDRAIELTEKLLANGQAQKKAMMQRLLTGKARLPGFRGHWSHVRICDLSTRVSRRNDGQNLPILTISSTRGFVRQDEKFRRYMAGKSAEDYISLRRGEFAYNKGNSKTYEFGCIFPLEEYSQALVPHVYVCFSINQGYDPDFYKVLFESDYLRPQLKRIVKTGVRNNGLLNITPAEFLETTLPVPPLDEQRAIATSLRAATGIVRELTNKLDRLKLEKSALMQQLLTGKRRVKLLTTSEEAA